MSFSLRAAWAGSLLWSWLGALLGWLLLLAHESSDLLEQLCGGSGAGCAGVLQSGWAVFPPDIGPLAERLPSIPVAAISAWYFTVVAIGVCVAGPRQWRRASSAVTTRFLLGGAAVVSVFYLVVMATQVEGWCWLCLASHVCNFGLFGSVYLGAKLGEPDGSPALGTRVWILTVGLGVAASAALTLAAGNHSLGRERDAAVAALGQLHRDGSLLELKYLSDEEHTATDTARARFDATLRAENPAMEAELGRSSTLVLYSDVECPSCATFERYLFDVVLPLYEGHLRVIYKHYPLEHLHDHAMEAARALEAARLQGRFWEMWSMLSGHRDRLDEVDYERVAEELELDAERFANDLRSAATTERIEQDQRDGRALGVTATPTVFLDRRPVDPSIRFLRAFWKLRADALRRSRERDGQGW